VTFHDGTPFNAEAVKFCYERQAEREGPYYKTGTYPYVKGFLGNVQSIEVVNPLTVQIKLKAPLTPFLQYLAHQSLFIYSPDALKKYGKDIVKNPVGTGPFKLETWEPGVKVVLARNDQYWGGAPKLRQAIYVPIIEAQARLAAIKTGEIDLTIDVRRTASTASARIPTSRWPRPIPRRSGTWPSTRASRSSRTSACGRP
jgi:peptide/nickel transport system substrate-binding protein